VRAHRIATASAPATAAANRRRRRREHRARGSRGPVPPVRGGRRRDGCVTRL